MTFKKNELIFNYEKKFNQIIGGYSKNITKPQKLNK